MVMPSKLKNERNLFAPAIARQIKNFLLKAHVTCYQMYRISSTCKGYWDEWWLKVTGAYFFLSLDSALCLLYCIS